MSYIDKLPQPQQMMNNLFDILETERSDLVDQIVRVKCLCYDANKYTKEELIEKILEVLS